VRSIPSELGAWAKSVGHQSIFLEHNLPPFPDWHYVTCLNASSPSPLGMVSI